MAKHRGRFGALLATVAALAALAAVTASPASAGWVGAKFSGESALKLTTTGMTAKRNGAEAKSCSIAGGSATGQTVGGGGAAEFGSSNWWGGRVIFFQCGGSAILEHYGTAVLPEYETVSGKYRLFFLADEFEPVWNPWGTHYWPGYYSVPFNNGSGETPSTFSFADTVVGVEASTGKKISLSGTYTITGAKGGLVTLTH